jgi:hypothetical protein
MEAASPVNNAHIVRERRAFVGIYTLQIANDKPIDHARRDEECERSGRRSRSIRR